MSSRKFKFWTLLFYYKKNNQWFILNDDTINNFNIETNKNIMYKDAYVLLYKKI